ncbi:MAG: hypothetical protein ACK4QP_19210 [Pseudorhizobium sp.]
MQFQGPVFVIALAIFIAGAPLMAKHADSDRHSRTVSVASAF